MNDYANLTELGRLFGLKNGAMGKLLKEIGLRYEHGSPTEIAKEVGYCIGISAGYGEHFLWHVTKTVMKLEEAGYRRVLQSPPISSGSLIGPFSYQVSNRFVHEIQNSNGEVVMTLSDQRAAEQTMNLLNLAHKHKRI
jgi:hypothetical protein